MEKTPLVSIIIPSYNHQKYIVETLNSIKTESYTNIEVLIIDDGSKDNSVKIIQKWIGLNKELSVNFTSRENKGLCATLNELVKKSRGKYIVPLASDDALCNDTLARRVELLENQPSKLVLVADAEGIDENGKIIYKSIMSDLHKVNKRKYYSDAEILDQVIFKFSISGAVLMANKEIYNLIGPYPENLKAEDLYFYIRAASLGKVFFYDLTVSKYRVHEFNTSGNNPELTKTVIRTYFRTINKVPGLYRKIRIIKRIFGLYIYR